MFNGVQNQEEIAMTKKKLLFLLPFFLFACGESPTASGDEKEIIGSWLHIESDDYAKRRMEFGKSGKLLISEEYGGETEVVIGTWSITADVLTLKVTSDGEMFVARCNYFIGGDRLTLVYIDPPENRGDSEVYERL